MQLPCRVDRLKKYVVIRLLAWIRPVTGAAAGGGDWSVRAMKETERLTVPARRGEVQHLSLREAELAREALLDPSPCTQAWEI